MYIQLITFAQDVEHELLTQVVQAERVNEQKFSMFSYYILHNLLCFKIKFHSSHILVPSNHFNHINKCMF